MTTINGGSAGSAAAGVFAATAAASADPLFSASCGEDGCAAPVVGGMRMAARFAAFSGGRAPFFSNGPGSTSFGAGRESLAPVFPHLDRMIAIATNTQLVPPEDVVRPLKELMGPDPALYMTIAARIVRETRARGGELKSDAVGRLFEALYRHLPTMRAAFAQAFVRRMHDLFCSQQNLSPNQLRIIRNMVVDRPEWAAEVVSFVRDASRPQQGFRNKIARLLDISLQEPVAVAWDDVK